MSTFAKEFAILAPFLFYTPMIVDGTSQRAANEKDLWLQRRGFGLA
jgi:hypothetical protein